MRRSNRPTIEAALTLMDNADRVLAAKARVVLDHVYLQGLHDVAAACLLEDGQMVVGLHVEATQGRASICAEGAMLSQACAMGCRVLRIVSVLRRSDDNGILQDYIIEPCGVCSELLADYCPDATVWVGDGDIPRRIAVRQLQPFRKDRPFAATR